MTVKKQYFSFGAGGACAGIPVSPEEDADICASAQEAATGPKATLPAP